MVCSHAVCDDNPLDEEIARPTPKPVDDPPPYAPPREISVGDALGQRLEAQAGEYRRESTLQGIGSWGVTCVILGIGGLVLPYIGLQFRILMIFGEATPIIAIGLAGVGVVLLILGNST